MGHTQGSGFDPQHLINGVWWHRIITQAFGRQKPEDREFKIILGYRGSLKPVWDTETLSQKKKDENPLSLLVEY